MYTTANFGLNIVEGADVVNPLVQQNPNFETIDLAMQANKQAGISSATELTAGSVHTITRANPDSNYIRFTATSNWTAGDTMVIDATPVSVFLSDGTVPGTGAYIINTEVFLIVNGSRATLFTSHNKQTASDVEYDNSGVNLSASNVNDAIDELFDDAFTSGSITRVFNVGGYVSASGNYFITTLPIRIAPGTNVTIQAISSSTVFLANSVVQNGLQLSGSSITNTNKDFLNVEFRFASAQTPEKPATAKLEIVLSIT